MIMKGLRTRAVIVLAVAVACTGLAACGSDQRPSLQPGPSTPPSTAVASPDDVKAGIRRGLASIRTLRAELVARHHGREDRMTLEMTADGFIRTTGGPLGGLAGVYDPREGVWYDEAGRERSGFPPGRPQPIGPDHGVLADPVLLGRHVLDWPHFRVVNTSVDGRAAWAAQWSSPRGSNPDYVAVTIDAQSGVALRAEGFFENQPVYEVQVVALDIDGDVQISPPPSDGNSGRTVNQGYTRTTMEEAATLAGYQPLIPAWLPPGFFPAEVAFAVQGSGSTPYTNPDATHTVSAAYRRGLDELVITTRRRGSRPWISPRQRQEEHLAQPGLGEGFATEVFQLHRWELVTIASGAFAGAHAERTRAYYGQSLYWALSDELHLEVRGDVTVEEMQRIVDSLRPM